MVLLLVIPMRRLMRLEDFITGRHIDVLCRLMLTSSLLHRLRLHDGRLHHLLRRRPGGHDDVRVRLYGIYVPVYWGTILFNILIPQLMWFPAAADAPAASSCWSALGIIVGMWLERYEIVITSLHRPHLPSSWGVFHATFWDWSTLAGTVGLFLSGILLSLRFVPAISMHEMRGLIGRQSREERSA